LRQSGAEVTGAILRLDGDTGTLSGKFHDGKLVLSHFSAARPALVEATLKADGTLEGIMNHTTKFVAARAAEASAKGLKEPPDPSRYTSVKDPSEPFHFSFADLEGRTVSETDPQFRGKVVIVNIMGSWCPNCHDETPFLVELYAKYHSQGLEIVGLAFEALSNLEEDRTQVRAFMKRHGITYPILIAGQSETGAVPKTLPQIANFDAYPTSFFLGRDGRVKSVHAGFASPATGAENLRLKREVEDTVKKLLAEKAPDLNSRLN
jgi:thiol-disulfide isomerase/thioredoxin